MTQGKRIGDFGISIHKKNLRELKKKLQSHQRNLRRIQKSKGTKIYGSPAFKRKVARELRETRKMLERLKK